METLRNNSSRLISSILNTNATRVNNVGILSSNSSASNSGLSGWSRWMPSMLTLFLLAVAITLIALGIVYRDTIKGWFEKKDTQAAPSSPTPSMPLPNDTSAMPVDAPSIVEKVLPPSGSKEVFAVSSNKYTYYDAEPLCRALGAELASYDQVKEAWNKGADWCNYGWVKGQMAVYPTQKETYEKLQGGPAEQRLACGKPGVNGGFFDNPELRFGAVCYGAKPEQSKHDETHISAGVPMSPDALEVEKKVAQFKSETGSIGILPFNGQRW